MAETEGSGAEDYYQRFTLPELVQMGFADSAADAEVNEAQWRKLGRVLSGASDTIDKLMKKMPEHYQSAQGAPELLSRLDGFSKKLQNYGQNALNNGTAWLGVKQSLEDAQGKLAAYGTVGAPLPGALRDEAADVVKKLSSELINHANDIVNLEGLDQGNAPVPLDNGPVGESKTVYGQPSNGGPVGQGDVLSSPAVSPVVGGLAPVVPTLGGSPRTEVPGRTGGARPGMGTPVVPVSKGGSTGVIGNPAGRAATGAVPGTVGGRAPAAPGGTAAAGGTGGGDPARTGLVGKPGAPGAPPPGTNAQAGTQPPGGPGRPAMGGMGGAPPGGAMSPNASGGGGPGAAGRGRDRGRGGRRGGGLLGDPNDFRYQAEFVAPAEIRPDVERPVTNIGKTIGGNKVGPAQPQHQPAPQAEQPGKAAKPRTSPLPESEVRMEGHNVSFKRSRGGGSGG